MPVVRVLWLIALAAAFSVGWLANGGRYIAQIAKADAVRAEQRAQAAAAALAKERAWQAAADKLKETQDVEVRSINTRLHAALAELRKRPTSPASASSDVPDSAGASESSSWCTGSRLYGDHAAAFAREAARASELQVDLRECRTMYDAVRGDFLQSGR